jgi:cell division protein FtsB
MDKERDGNKIYFPDKNIYLMDQHKWAFYIWEFARERGLIKPDATLFHVDAHTDDCP